MVSTRGLRKRSTRADIFSVELSLADIGHPEGASSGQRMMVQRNMLFVEVPCGNDPCLA